jgi:hypothetical protein
MRIAPALLALAACTASEEVEVPADSESAFPEYEGRVEGRLTDPDGQALSGLKVTLCATVCQVTDAASDGSFVFEGAWPGNNVLETTNYPGDDQVSAVLEWGRAYDLVSIDVDEQIVLDRPLVVHPVTTVQNLTGPQDLSFADLRVVFDADAVIAQGIPFPAEQIAIGATVIDEANWPTGIGSWTVHKAWSMAVWDLRLDDGFAVTATLDSAIPADREVAFLVADYTHGFREGTFFEEAATLSSDGLTLSTPTDGGMDRVTVWLAASRPLD